MPYTPSHLTWLDRQPSRGDGYPNFLTTEDTQWLEGKIKAYLTQCELRQYHPVLYQVVDHWTRAIDVPKNLRFPLNEAIYGVTSRALFAVAENRWVLKS